MSPIWVSAQKKPNVIIIYTDDQATLDVNVLGAKDLVSPHMDQLLLSGTTFTQFYASPVCSPSRASLLTGKTLKEQVFLEMQVKI